jgi:protein-S-isoprenylcysteine O-methyltransferase Ste14
LEGKQAMEISVKYLYAVLGWVLWCTLHSALISITLTEFAKKKLGGSFRFYRLFYNVVSLVTLIPLVYYSHMLHEAPIFRWEGPLGLVQVFFLAVSVCLFVAGGRHYSWARFLGISQVKAGSSLADSSTFVVSGIHRIIRHPWYLGGILIVWAQDLSTSTILINMVINVYFIVGSFLEERKLLLEFGEKYREYQRTVSMLFPWRWLKARIEGG